MFQYLVTDSPVGSFLSTMNTAFVKGGKVYLRNAAAGKDIELCEYVAGLVPRVCSSDFEDIRDGACRECTDKCHYGFLFISAYQAAHLRERLREYEEKEKSKNKYCWVCGKKISDSEDYYKQFLHDSYCCEEHRHIGEDMDADKNR